MIPMTSQDELDDGLAQALRLWLDERDASEREDDDVLALLRTLTPTEQPAIAEA